MKSYVLIICLFFVFSCQDQNKYQEQLLGKWHTKDWYVKASGDRIAQKMDFTFETEKRYEIDYGSEIEKGIWWIESSNGLITHEDNGIAKKVIIDSLVNNTLWLTMNRSGQLETLILNR